MKTYLLAFLVLHFHCFAINNEKAAYSNFYYHPELTKEMRKLMKPHLLPLDHPLKPILDSIFFKSRAIANEHALKEAGFTIHFSMKRSFITIASHPKAPGYLFKLYLDSETRLKKGRAGWEWLVDRCIGAAKIRELLKKGSIQHFVVPDKWLYILPLQPPPTGPIHQPIILVVTDMQVIDNKKRDEVWKTKITPAHLNELYYILKHGCGSSYLRGNIAYTKNSKFAFIDTEYPDRKIKLEKVKRFLSFEMRHYWEALINGEKMYD